MADLRDPAPPPSTPPALAPVSAPTPEPVGRAETPPDSGIPYPGDAGRNGPEELQPKQAPAAPANPQSADTVAAGMIRSGATVVVDRSGLRLRFPGIQLDEKTLLFFSHVRNQGWSARYTLDNFEVALSNFLCDSVKLLFTEHGLEQVIIQWDIPSRNGNT